MGFAVPADAYDRFMGRYSTPLSPLFATYAGVAPGERVLDVGCGPGALTAELVRRVGNGSVVAVDPAPAFVEAVRARYPGVEAYECPAEQLPLADGTVDRALAQLVVHFMADPLQGVREMGRVTRPGGAVAACVWDYAEGGSPLTLFWHAVKDLDVRATGEDELPGTRRGQLGRLFASAGLVDVVEDSLAVTVRHHSFEEWWQPFELGVGPAGAYVAALSPDGRRRLSDRCGELLGEPPFTVVAAAWTALGRVPG